jgi:hypothetical protein
MLIGFACPEDSLMIDPPAPLASLKEQPPNEMYRVVRQ